MGISYKKLWVKLIEKDISRAALKRDLGLSSGTMSKLNKSEVVSMTVILRICEYLNCNVGDVCDAVPQS